MPQTFWCLNSGCDRCQVICALPLVLPSICPSCHQPSNWTPRTPDFRGVPPRVAYALSYNDCELFLRKIGVLID